MLTDEQLNRIESQATHTRTKADTLALIAEVRRLRAVLADASRIDDTFERATDALGESCLNILPPFEPHIERAAGPYAELAELRAELDALRPLADMAVSYAALVDDGKKMTYAKEYNLECETSDLQKAALAFARARAAVKSQTGSL